MAMKSRKQYGGVAHVGNASLYPSISPAYWSPQAQTAPYAVPGKNILIFLIQLSLNHSNLTCFIIYYRNLREILFRVLKIKKLGLQNITFAIDQ